MIGFSATEPREIGPFLQALARQSREGCRPPGCERFHEDGYGLALLRDGHWLLVHEQCPVWEGALNALGKLRANVALLHSRLATDDGTINITKLHPFATRSGSGELVMCHNGSILGHQKLFVAAGLPADTDTDSIIDTEVYMRFVQRAYEQTGDMAAAVESAATAIYRLVGPSQARSLNLLASDGTGLVAYKGQIQPRFVGYHTLFTARGEGVAVVSTQEFAMDGLSEWKPLEGAMTLQPG